MRRQKPRNNEKSNKNHFSNEDYKKYKSKQTQKVLKEIEGKMEENL